jgi:MFS family permease
MDEHDAVPATTAAFAANRQRRALTAGMASILAWSFDLFDLFILLYVATTIAPLFFPSKIATLSLAAVYIGFAFTLLFRPLGAAIFGAYADRRGRKWAMAVAVLGVGVATALLGTLPTIAQAGLVGPVLFFLLRMVQGIFVGGVVASTHTLGTESVSPRWRGLLSGLIGGGGAAIGGLLASVIFLAVSSVFPGKTFGEWGWRVMFFSGLLSSLFSLLVFWLVEESPIWEDRERSHRVDKTPLRTLLSSRYRGVFLLNLLVVFGSGATYYLTSGFLPTFLVAVNKLTRADSAVILIWANLGIIVAAPLFGHLSEMIGRRRTFLVAGVMNLVLVPIVYLSLGGYHGRPAFVPVLLLALALSFLGNAAYAPVLIFLNERFPTAIRSTGTGLSWNTGFALGGIMPAVVTVAAGKITNLPVYLAAFVFAVTVVYLFGALVTPETRGHFEGDEVLTQIQG